jgi:hypothetical protein
VGLLPQARVRLLSPSVSYGPYSDPLALTSGDTDGDLVLDPGESWVWSYATPVANDQSFVDAWTFYTVFNGPLEALQPARASSRRRSR